jgi:hypothetical protein
MLQCERVRIVLKTPTQISLPLLTSTVVYSVRFMHNEGLGWISAGGKGYEMTMVNVYILVWKLAHGRLKR